MAELTSEERVLRVLRRQEPDRVPHFEWLVERKVRAALCPGCKTGLCYQPDPQLGPRYAEWYQIYTQLYPALKPLSHQLYDQFRVEAGEAV